MSNIVDFSIGSTVHRGAYINVYNSPPEAVINGNQRFLTKLSLYDNRAENAVIFDRLNRDANTAIVDAVRTAIKGLDKDDCDFDKCRHSCNLSREEGFSVREDYQFDVIVPEDQRASGIQKISYLFRSYEQIGKTCTAFRGRNFGRSINLLGEEIKGYTAATQHYASLGVKLDFDPSLQEGSSGKPSSRFSFAHSVAVGNLWHALRTPQGVGSAQFAERVGNIIKANTDHAGKSVEKCELAAQALTR